MAFQALRAAQRAATLRGERAPRYPDPPPVGRWAPDVLGAGFEARTLPLADDDEGEAVATLVRYTGAPRRALEIAKAAARVAAFSVMAAAAWAVVPAASMRFALRTSGNVGKLLFFIGRPAWNLY